MTCHIENKPDATISAPGINGGQGTPHSPVEAAVAADYTGWLGAEPPQARPFHDPGKQHADLNGSLIDTLPPAFALLCVDERR